MKQKFECGGWTDGRPCTTISGVHSHLPARVFEGLSTTRLPKLPEDFIRLANLIIGSPTGIPDQAAEQNIINQLEEAS